MKYFKVMYDYENESKYAGCAKCDLKGLDQYSTMQGIPLKNTYVNPVFYLNFSKGNILSDYLQNVYGWLLVSNQFVKLAKPYFERAVEYLPVDLINNSMVLDVCYCAINITNVIDALDLENSQYSVLGEDDWKVLAVQKYAFKEAAIQGHHIFKVKDSVIPVFVSEVIKDLVEKNGLTGFSFLEVKVG